MLLQIHIMITVTAIVTYLLHAFVQRNWIKTSWAPSLAALPLIAMCAMNIALPQNMNPMHEVMHQIYEPVAVASKSAETGTAAYLISRESSAFTWSIAELLICLHGAAFLLFIVRLFTFQKRVQRFSYPLRQTKTLSIRITQHYRVPFCAWDPWYGARIVIPQDMMLEPQWQKIALHHEFYHLKNYHCLRALMISAVRYVFFPLGTPTMADSRSTQTLKRRFVMMKQRTRPRMWFSVSLAASLTLGGALLGAATGSQNKGSNEKSVSRISDQQWQQLLTSTNATSTGIKITDHPSIRTQLEKTLSEPGRREEFRNSLTRMKEYETLINTTLAEQHLPAELMAVPIVESGYQNIKQGPKKQHGAGLWMFVEPTAEMYGLAINKTSDIDERLDIRKESIAAAKMFRDLYEQFQDWHFALLAYNAGAKTVATGRKAKNAKTAFSLIEGGVENDKNYLPKVLSAVILLKNPSLL